MKKLFGIIIITTAMLFIGAGKAEAQWVVHDPGHTFLNSTEWYTNVKKWIEQIKEMEAAQKLREGLQNIDRMKELKSLKELADLLDDVACLSQDYSFYMNVGSNYHCLKFLNFQRVTVNLSVSTDLLMKVATVTSYFSMNSEGRISFIEQVKESVEKAADEMLNRAVMILDSRCEKVAGGTFHSFANYILRKYSTICCCLFGNNML